MENWQEGAELQSNRHFVSKKQFPCYLNKSLLEMALGDLTDKMIVPICSVIIAGEEALGSAIFFPPVHMVVSPAVYGKPTETC